MWQVLTRYPATEMVVGTYATPKEALDVINRGGGAMKLCAKNGSIEFAYNGLVAWVNEQDIWVNHTPDGRDIVMAAKDK